MYGDLEEHTEHVRTMVLEMPTSKSPILHRPELHESILVRLL